MRSDVGTTVRNGRSDPRSVCELSGFLVDLRHQFSRRGKDKGARIDLSSRGVRVGVVDGRGLRASFEQRVQDREQETTGLSGTSLSTSHQVTTVVDDGDRVLLHGRRRGVMCKLDIVQKNWVDRRRGEFQNRVGNAGTGSLDGNVGVLVEVDTRRLVNSVIDLAVELLLHPHVPVSRNVLSILPRTESIGDSVESTTADTAAESTS